MPQTIRELIERGHQQLKTAGILNSRLASEIILRQLLQLRRVDLYLKESELVPNHVAEEFDRLIERKLRREPLQYIVGETEWFGLTFECSPAALIPRPETEIVVERALELIAEVYDPAITDIGTGTGCIAVAIALNRPDSRIVAADISQEALDLAQRNVIRHGVGDRVSLRAGDLFEPVEPEALFDLIISNPPYVSEAEYTDLMPEVRDYEPRRALLAGNEGLDIVYRLVAEAHQHLKSHGLLVLEIGEKQAERVRRRVVTGDKYEFLEIIVDYNGKDRGIVLQKR